VIDGRELIAAIGDIAGSVTGVVAVDARNLSTGERVELRAEERFPSASVIKIAILVELYAQVEEGRLSLAEACRVRAEEKVDGSGVLTQLHAGLQVTVEDLARLMITVSDNTASNMLLDRLGCDAVTARMASLGLSGIVMGRKFYDFAARDRGRENWVAAGDLSSLLEKIERRQIVSPAGCGAMIGIMLKQQFDGRIPRRLPPDVKVANKTGTISTACHDAGIIYAPSGPIALTVLTRDVPELADAEEVIRRVAKAVYGGWGCVG
jgi:beta-lactamase class A